MAVTKSWDSRVAPQLTFKAAVKNTERRREFWWLLSVTLLVGYGLAVVFTAKTQDFPDLQAKLTSGDLLDLNASPSKDTLDKALIRIDDPSERGYVAERLQAFLSSHAPLSNIGALARLRLTAADSQADPAAVSLWQTAIANRKVPPASVPLLAISKFKPLVVVRTPKSLPSSISPGWAFTLQASG